MFFFLCNLSVILQLISNVLLLLSLLLYLQLTEKKCYSRTWHKIATTSQWTQMSLRCHQDVVIRLWCLSNKLGVVSGLRRLKDFCKTTSVWHRLSDVYTTLIKMILPYFVLSKLFREFLMFLTAQKMKFSIKDFFSKYDQWPNPQFPADLVTFTEKILNGNLHFLCSEILLQLVKAILS